MDWKLEVLVVPVRDVDRAKEFYGTRFTGPVHFVDGRVEPGHDPQDQDFATFAFFDDPDGNTWAVQQGRRNGG